MTDRPIPESVMSAANEVADRFFPMSGSPVSIIVNEALSEAIARAILAEREGCARIADSYTPKASSFWDPGLETNALMYGQEAAAEFIAEAIRGRP